MSTAPTPGHKRGFWIVLIVFLIGVLTGMSLNLLHPSAYAQIPDAGMQRNQLQKEMEALNARVGDVLTLLRTQTFKVRIVQEDEGAGAKPAQKPASSQEKPRPGQR